jgi:hypothetical protein
MTEAKEAKTAEKTTGSTQTLVNQTEEGKTVEKTLVEEQFTPEEQAEQDAENKRLLEAEEEDLDDDEKAQRAELVKAQEKAKASKEVPEKYEFKVPEGTEGMEIDENMVNEFTPTFKELGLTQEQAQKLVDKYAPLVKQQAEAQTKEALDFHENQKNEWKQESMKALGTNAKTELSHVARLINTFADKEDAQLVREMFELSGLGNYLPMIRLLSKAGKKLAPDKMAETNKKAGIDLEDPSILYK